MSATQRNSIIFTTGCHSGLSVPDGAAPGSRLDFAQVLVGQGAIYLANTGYGYGDADAIGYSERLMQRFTEELTQGQVVVGTALRRAKTTYFNELGVRSLTPYHEKVLGVATFYGLPMIRLHLGAQVTAAAETVAPMLTARTGGAADCPAGLHCRNVTINVQYEEHSVEGFGRYYTVAGTQAVQDTQEQPIQPRAAISLTQSGQIARLHL